MSKKRKTALGTPYALSKRGDGPNPIDIHVGQKLRLRRTMLGLSQEALAETIGITFQQLQKYERGANRISASRLYNLSCVMKVPVTYFFDTLPSNGDQDQTEEMNTDMPDVSNRETLELVRAYRSIPLETIRKKAFDLVKSLSKIDG